MHRSRATSTQAVRGAATEGQVNIDNRQYRQMDSVSPPLFPLHLVLSWLSCLLCDLLVDRSSHLAR